MDRRMARTRRRLKEALVALTQEKGYEALTIQEITTRAGVGYRTFFRHYSSKEALLQDLLASLLEDLRALMVIPAGDQTRESEAALAERGRRLFEHVAAHPGLYAVLLHSGPSVYEAALAVARQEAQQATRPVDLVPAELAANHLAAATLGMINWWLDNGMPYTPGEMGAFMARLLASSM